MTNYLLLRTKGTPAWNPIFFSYTLDVKTCKQEELKTEESFSHTNCKNEVIDFICKHKKVSFDYHQISSGNFFVSQRFLAVVEELLDVNQYRVKKVRFLSTKGVPITDQNYFVLYITKQIDAVDAQKSTFQKAKYVPLDETVRLVFRESISEDLYRIKNNYTFGPDLFCSQEFKDKADSFNLEFIPLPIENSAELVGKR